MVCLAPFNNLTTRLYRNIVQPSAIIFTDIKEFNRGWKSTKPIRTTCIDFKKEIEVVITRFKGEITRFKGEIASLKGEITCLKGEITRLKAK